MFSRPTISTERKNMLLKVHLVSWLHRHLVWHLHLRPSSVFLDDETLAVKVADYSTALLEPCFEQLQPHRLRGCSPWTPPELLRGAQGAPGPSADVYAFGVILWELLARRPPFEGLTAAQLIVAVGFGRRRLPKPQAPPPALGSLARRCLRREAAARPSFDQVVVVLQRLEAGDSAKEDALGAFFGAADRTGGFAASRSFASAATPFAAAIAPWRSALLLAKL